MRRAIVLAALLVCGCVSVLPEPSPPPVIFPMRANTAPLNVAIPAGRVVAVATPTVPATLSGPDIVWKRNGSLAFMERAAWQSRTPEALQGQLIETIDLQDAFLAATSAGEGVRADYEIRWTVLDFQIEEDASLRARFNAEVKLMDLRTRRLVDARRVELSVGLDKRSAGAAAAALSGLSAQAGAAIGAWVAEVAAAGPQLSAASTSK